MQSALTAQGSEQGLLGVILVRRGLITNDQLGAALEAERRFWRAFDARRWDLYEKALRPYALVVRQASLPDGLLIPIDEALRLGPPLGTTLHGYERDGAYHVKTTHWYLMQTPENDFEPETEEERAAIQEWKETGIGIDGAIISAEIAASIAEEAIWELDAPIRRVCSVEVPMPYARHMEEAALPQPAEIVAAARELVGR